MTHICQATAKSNVNYFKSTYLFQTLINATKQIDLPAVIFNDPHCFPFLCIEKWYALCQLNHTNVSFDKFIWKTDYSRFLYFLVIFFGFCGDFGVSWLERPKGVKDLKKERLILLLWYNSNVNDIKFLLLLLDSVFASKFSWNLCSNRVQFCLEQSKLPPKQLPWFQLLSDDTKEILNRMAIVFWIE